MKARLSAREKELWLTAETQLDAVLLAQWEKDGKIPVKSIGALPDGSVSITIPVEADLMAYSEYVHEEDEEPAPVHFRPRGLADAGVSP